MAGSLIVDSINNEDVSSGFFGVGQTWQDVTGSRASGVTYTNTTGKPITVIFSVESTDTQVVRGYVDSYQVARFVCFAGGGGNALDCMSFIVPNSSTYKIDYSSTGLWFELR